MTRIDDRERSFSRNTRTHRTGGAPPTTAEAVVFETDETSEFLAFIALLEVAHDYGAGDDGEVRD